MKKSLLVGSILVAMSVSSLQAKDEWFVGLEVGSTSATFEMSFLGTEVNEKDSTGSQSLKVGKYFEYGRAYIMATRYSTEANVDLSSYGLGYDYIFNNSSSFTPFVGLNIGKFDYQKSGLNAELVGTGATVNKDTIDISGITYGLNLGVGYDINENFNLELGARLIKNNASDTISVTSDANTVSIDAEITKITQVYIGLNYKF